MELEHLQLELVDAKFSMLRRLLKELKSYLLTSGALQHTAKFVSGNVQDGFTKLRKGKSGKLSAMMKISTAMEDSVRGVQEEWECIMIRTV